jgi:hypothetical protein
MIKKIENLPENIVGFTYKGKVNGKDYENVVFPILKKVASGKNKIRIIFKLDKSFSKISMKAVMDDTFAGLKYSKKIEKIAVISNNNKINHIIRAFSFLFPGDIKIFPLSESKKAIEWGAN